MEMQLLQLHHITVWFSLLRHVDKGKGLRVGLKLATTVNNDNLIKCQLAWLFSKLQMSSRFCNFVNIFLSVV